MRKFPQLLGTLRKCPLWVGQVAAHIASEEISTVAGNTEEISLVLGQLAAYITSEEISTVVGNTEEISSAWAFSCIYYK